MNLEENVVALVSEELFVRASTTAAPDAVEVVRRLLSEESDEAARERLRTLLKNADLSHTLGKPICQTFATPCAYVKAGSQLTLRGDLGRAIRKGVEAATARGYLRPSIVDPISRVPLGGNVGRYVPDIEVELVEGDFLELSAFCTTELPPSNVRIFYPQQIGVDGIGIKKHVVRTVMMAGGVPCPPMAVGVGIGGSMDGAARLSKRAALKPWTEPNPDPKLAEWEGDLLNAINRLGIGPFGLGGDTTVIAVKVEMADAHAADLPVAVNLFCSACAFRRATARISADGTIEYRQP